MPFPRRSPRAETPVQTDEIPAAPGGKGRPTPKRRDAQKRRRAPVPTDRKQAAAQRRDRLRSQRQLQRQALRTGDERNLPGRDAGPAKRLARDYVDSRFTIGQIFFGLILVVLVLSFVHVAVVAIVVNLFMLLIFAGVLFNSIQVGRRARAEVEKQFGVKESTGITGYAAMRAMQPRRMRRPPPRVHRGDRI